MQTRLAEWDARYEGHAVDTTDKQDGRGSRALGLQIPFSLKKFQGAQKPFLLYLWIFIVT